MKLSEMSTRQLAGTLCALTVPMSKIAADESLNGVFTQLKNAIRENEHMTDMQKMSMLLEAVPILLEKHYEDSVKIISAMTGKSIAEIDEQNGMQTIIDLRDCIDTQFLDFFKSSAAMGKTERVRAE